MDSFERGITDLENSFRDYTRTQKGKKKDQKKIRKAKLNLKSSISLIEKLPSLEPRTVLTTK